MRENCSFCEHKSSILPFKNTIYTNGMYIENHRKRRYQLDREVNLTNLTKQVRRLSRIMFRTNLKFMNTLAIPECFQSVNAQGELMSKMERNSTACRKTIAKTESRRYAVSCERIFCVN